MQSDNPTAAILVIGDEILSGRTREGNAHHLAQVLTATGIDLQEIRVVADDTDRIVDAIRALELETVKVSMANLRTFTFVRAAEDAGQLSLHGAWFSIKEGVLWVMGEDGAFAPAS